MKYVDKYPALIHEWVLFHRPNGGFLKYVAEEKILKSKVFDLTELAVKSILLCDGTKTIADILNDINETCDADNFSPVESTTHFLFELIQNGIISLMEEPKLCPVLEKGSKEKFYPLHFAIELTDACNLRCKHCYRDSSPDLSQRLPTQTLMELLCELHENEVQSLELSGGEPTYHPDFVQILEYSLQNFGSVALLTNGTLLNSIIYNLLEKYKNRAIVQIDLDGCNAQEHDKLRGISGSFSKAVNSIIELSSRGVKVRVAMCLHSDNFESIEKTYQIAKQNGAKWFTCSPVMDIGRASENMLLTWEQLQWSMTKLDTLAKLDPEMVLTASELKRLSGKLGSNCGAGSSSIALGPDGSLRPCFLVNKKIPAFKNILDTCLEEAIAEAPLDFFRSLEPPCPELCGDCTYVIFCYGCIARPLLAWERARKEGNPIKCYWNESTGFGASIGITPF